MRHDGNSGRAPGAELEEGVHIGTGCDERFTSSLGGDSTGTGVVGELQRGGPAETPTVMEMREGDPD